MAFLIQPVLQAIEKSSHTWLLSQPIEPIAQWRSRDHGATILHQFARHGSPDPRVLDWLLQGGMDINAQDARGNTPLHCVFERPESSSLTWMRLLVDRGADLKAHNHDYATALTEAAAQRKWACVKYALSQGAPRWIKNTPWESSLEGRIAAFMPEKMGVNAIDPLSKINQRFPASVADNTRGLFMSLQHGSWSLAKFYLQQGADALTTTPSGSTALHMVALGCTIGRAKQKDDNKMVETIASLGVDPVALNEMGVDCYAYIQDFPQIMRHFKAAISMGVAKHLENQSLKPTHKSPSRRM